MAAIPLTDKMNEQSIVLYQPDKGAAFGHALRPSRPAPAWKAVQGFFGGFAEAAQPSGVRLVAYRATAWDDSDVVGSIVESVIKRFGSPSTTTAGGMNISTGEALVGGYLEWRGDESTWPAFVQFVADGCRWPKTTLGPVSAQACFRFRWNADVDPEANRTQAMENELNVSLERTSFTQPRFWFPHPVGSPALIDLVRRVAVGVPFRLSARHFRAAVPKKDGSGFLLRRFDAASLLAA